MTSLDTPVSRRLQNVKHIIIVLSGKGGVGKSSVSVQLALSLYSLPSSPRVGILDTDLTGPSIPRMLGIETNPVHQSSDGWVPVFADGSSARLACMSVGFLLKRRDDSVVWRGPKKNAMIRQFLSDVRWGDLDFLVIDTPPGTSDEHLSLMEHLAPLQSLSRLSSVIVTTPQIVALSDTMKCVSFTRTVSLPIVGLIENMSGYACPCCGEITNVFSTGGGEAMANREGLTFLGALPIDTQLVDLLDCGGRRPQSEVSQEETENASSNETFPVLDGYHKTPTYSLFEAMAEKVVSQLDKSPEVDVV